MDRCKLRIRPRRGNGFPYKRDTPVKVARWRREKNNRLRPCRHYDPLPEEPEVDETDDPHAKPEGPLCDGERAIYPLQSEVDGPVPSASVSHLRAPAENPKSQASLFAVAANTDVSWAGSPAVQVQPILQALKGGHTPESGTSCSTEQDSTFCSEEEEEEDSDCFSVTSTTLSSVPSPEIFRTETVQTPTFQNKESGSLHLHDKNSTLLDVSHAQSIQMYQLPNLSAIIDASTIPTEKKNAISHFREPESEGKIKNNSFNSDRDPKRGDQLKLDKRKPVLCRKKVCFKSPTIAEIFIAKNTPSSTMELCSYPEKKKPDVDTSKMDEINIKEETLPLKVMLKRPVETSPVKAKFFDFGSDAEQDAYFQKMRERSAKLNSAVL
ncbi:unnamed protein product [Menidia menidia]|uniref:(Atlantic silverside) hypothetical protein n=1 Tax=Menidia menidia TaxID=238744 RepID=A0A8S4AUK8_9TELE|nr:unnamed protein product [Menidia menidia]